ncbi:MAG TPA: alkaline phosphatase family protein [Candidatus Pullichristensenella avicola]|nr:alkaline phosphatase family protein [Candidatus Pullichristensenella avicola]
MNLVYPDYDRSILSTLSALTGYFGAPLSYPPLEELAPLLATKPRHVMLLLLDGMGGAPLRRALGEDSYLRAHEIATVTSIFPPTTAAAATAYYCGKSALESGWLGWHLYMKEFASDVVAFKRTAYYTGNTLEGPFPAGLLIPYETVFERMKGACDTHVLYAFDSYCEHGADFRHRVSSFADVLNVLRMISQGDGPSFTIAYWNQPDAKMHRYGVSSPEAAAEFRALDRQLSALRGRLRDTLLVVTADHGMVDTTQAVDIATTPALLEPLVLPPSIEPRASAFYVKRHRREAFEAAFRALCGEDFLLLSREEALASGLFGRGTPHPKFDDFLGDYLGVATGRRYFAFSLPGAGPGDRLIGQHAGLTEDEMLVSVLADRM